MSASEIKEAISALPPVEQQLLREWMLSEGGVSDPEANTPELEAELLKAVQGSHSSLTREKLDAIADRAGAELRARRSA